MKCVLYLFTAGHRDSDSTLADAMPPFLCVCLRLLRQGDSESDAKSELGLLLTLVGAAAAVLLMVFIGVVTRRELQRLQALQAQHSPLPTSPHSFLDDALDESVGLHISSISMDSDSVSVGVDEAAMGMGATAQEARLRVLRCVCIPLSRFACTAVANNHIVVLVVH